MSEADHGPTRTRTNRLVGKFAAYVIGFSSVIAVGITGAELMSGYYDDIHQIDRRMQQIEVAYVDSVSKSFWVQDKEQLDIQLQGIARLPDFVLAEVRADGRSVRSWGRALNGQGVTSSFLLQHVHRGQLQQIGELVVSASYDGAAQRVRERLLYFLFANTVKTTLVAMFILIVFHRLVGRHLQHMANYARGHAVTEAAEPLRLLRQEPGQEDELATLAASINHMRDELQAANQAQRERADLLETELLARRLAETRLHLMASVFQNSQEAIVLTDVQNKIMATNPAFAQLTGYGHDEVVGKNPRVLSAGTTPVEVYRQMWDSLKTQGAWQGEVWDRRRDGSVYPKWLSISAVRDDGGAVCNYIGIFSDITQRKQAEEDLFRLAHRDSLTGLHNRVSLKQELKQAIDRAKLNQEVLAVMSIDLDLFKNINNVYGHQTGDQVLLQVAQRLSASVRDSGAVARPGADEFVLVLHPVNAINDVVQIAESIHRTLDQPYMIESKHLRVASSIGLALFPVDGEDVEVLLKRADVAMHQAKEQGRNNVKFYTASHEQAVHERLRFEHDLRQALGLRQFELHYQPKFEARGLRLVGVEALLRWNHPELGRVPPDRFIPVAEQIGLIERIGEWVLDEACRQMRAWREQGFDGIGSVAVNLSAQQLNSSELLDFIGKTLDKNGLGVECLELEITESMLMQDIDTNVQRLRALRKLGIKLSIDDFGTGYSSLSYLKLLPIHALKLDRSFVGDIETDAGSTAICISTIALAHNLGLKVIAEGVETAAQRDFLEQHRCDHLQGYLLGRPQPAAQLLESLSNSASV